MKHMDDLLEDLDKLVQEYKFENISGTVIYREMIGCIGWFADSSNGKAIGIRLGILSNYRPREMYPFEMKGYGYFSQFRPAKPSEVKFYEKA